MNKNILKSLMFILGLIILLTITSYIFTPKSNGKNSGIHEQDMHGILGEKKNTIDILIIGDSESYTSVIPLVLYNKFGFTSYNLGTSDQRIYDTYEHLNLALKNQTPKVVVLETNIIFSGVPKNDLLNHSIEKVFKIFKYHDRWKHLSISDLEYPNYNWRDVDKNYPFTTEQKDPEYIYDYMIESNEMEKIAVFNLLYLNAIKEVCEKNNIELILMSAPSILNWNYKKHNSILEYANKNKLKFIDFNIKNKTGIDWKKDTRDHGDHLNYHGSLKVTRKLGLYLNSLNILTDHRGDKKFSSWEKDYQEFKRSIKEN